MGNGWKKGTGPIVKKISDKWKPGGALEGH
jgi:hypothetical protein